MIDVKDIDPFSLPSVVLSDRDRLPQNSAIYFVLAEDEVVYVGKACNLVVRWHKHHKLRQLESLEDVRIAWMICDDLSAEEQFRIEQECILRFRPCLDGMKTYRPLHLRTTPQKQREERYRRNTIRWETDEPIEWLEETTGGMVSLVGMSRFYQ